MTKHTLKAQPRLVVGRHVKQLRRQGWVPANVFGKDATSTNVQIEEKPLLQFLKEAGESSLMYLQVAGDKTDRPVMIAELRRDPVTERLLHVGLHQVNLKEKISTAVPVKLIGEAPAEKEKQGILVQLLDEVEIEALPADMPEAVEINVAGLAAVNDAVYVKDIQVDAKLTVKSDSEAIVAKIEPLAAEEPKEAPPVAVGEGEVPAEGEAAQVAEGEKPAEEEVKAAEKTGE